MAKALGIDIGGMSIKCGLVDESGKISTRFRLPIDMGKSGEETMTDLVSLIKKNVKEDILGVGVGCPGAIDSEHGICKYTNNLRWHDLHVGEILEKGLGKKTKVINDANAAMLGEAAFGAARGKRNAVLFTLGTGVGGGLFLDGKLFEGFQSRGAELGHMVLKIDGRKCTCGKRGCIEAYASVTALINDTKRGMRADRGSKMWDYVHGDISKVDGRTAFECSKLGDKTASKIVKNYIHYLGEAIYSIINLIRPEVIILGGGLSGQKGYLTGLINDYIDKEGGGYGGPTDPKCQIVTTDFGNDAGIIGAATTILRPELI
jgi:glucokinase